MRLADSSVIRAGLRIARRPFVRDVGLLQIGAVWSAGVGLITSVALARLLHPDGFGTFALVVSIGTTIGLLRRLGQDQAATTQLAEATALFDRELARKALSYYVAVSIWTSVAVLPAAFLLAPPIGAWFYGDPEIGSQLRLYLVPAIWAVVPGWTVLALQATRRIGQLVWFENGSTFITAALGVGGAFMGLGVSGVLAGHIVASLVVLLAGIVVYSRIGGGDRLLPAAAVLLRASIRPDFPVWREMRSGLSMALDKNLATVYTLFPILLLGLVAEVSQVAQLRVALSYVAIPALLLGPVSRLLMVKLPELKAQAPERLRGFYLSVIATAGLCSIALTLPFVVLAPWLIGLLFGPDFLGSIPLVYILAVDAALLGFGVAAGPMFRTLDRTDLPIRVHAVVLGLGLPAAYFLINSWGPAGAAIGYVALMLALRLITNGLCWRVLPG